MTVTPYPSRSSIAASLISPILWLKLMLGLLLCFAAVIGLLNYRSLFPALLVIATVNLERPLVLKNIFLAYAFLLFIVSGSHYFPDDPGLARDMFIYVVSFLAAYSFGFGKPQRVERIQADERVMDKALVRIERLVWLFCVIQVVLLLLEIRQVGLRNFYGGAGMVLRIEAYGKRDVWFGLLTIVRFASSMGTYAVAILYVYVSYAAGRRPKLLLLALLLAGLPLLMLQRSAFATGVMFLLVAYSLGRAASAKSMQRMFVAAVLVALVAIGLGVLRERRLMTGLEGDTSWMAARGMLLGELSPVVAYQEIKINMDELDLQKGRTIVLPLLFKVIPRNWMPDKPMPSSGYYMYKLRPAEAQAGFFIAPSFFGDLYLNFGFIGVVAGCALIGWAWAKMDRVYLQGKVRGLWLFLLMFLYAYHVLRSNLADTLSFMLLTGFVYWLLHHWAGIRLRRLGSPRRDSA